MGGRRKLLSRKVNLCFFRHEVHVRKNHNSRGRLLGDLRPPPRFGAGVVTFPLLETQLQKKIDQIDEVLSRTTKSMVIMISPTEAEPVLSKLLDLGRAVPAGPVIAFGFEKELAA